MHIDCFSGPAADLPKGQRSADSVLRVLVRSPRVSTWDMSETPWLRNCIERLSLDGLIRSDEKEPYPWCRYVVTASGLDHLNAIGANDERTRPSSDAAVQGEHP
jgi:hypothetical protein